MYLLCWDWDGGDAVMGIGDPDGEKSCLSAGVSPADIYWPCFICYAPKRPIRILFDLKDLHAKFGFIHFKG